MDCGTLLCDVGGVWLAVIQFLALTSAIGIVLFIVSGLIRTISHSKKGELTGAEFAVEQGARLELPVMSLIASHRREKAYRAEGYHIQKRKFNMTNIVINIVAALLVVSLEVAIFWLGQTEGRRIDPGALYAGPVVASTGIPAGRNGSNDCYNLIPECLTKEPFFLSKTIYVLILDNSILTGLIKLERKG